jgi:hypothetical protein
MNRIKIAVLFECSGKVADAFDRLGHYAESVDILERYTEGWTNHCNMPVDDWLNYEEGIHGSKYDLIIMHPPCTALSCSGNRWYGAGMPNHQKRLDSITQTLKWYDRAKALADHVALENPVGVLTGILGKPQYIQPWQFGHGETKRTGLWLHNLPELKPTDIVDGRENRIWRMPPSADRAKMRSETFQGIADAMAHQWSAYILGNNKQPTQKELNDEWS